MAGSGLQEHINIMFAGNAVRHNYVDWQGHHQSCSWPHVDRCCIEHHSCSEGIPHSVATQGDRLAQNGTQQVLIPRTMTMRQTNRSKSLFMLHLIYHKLKTTTIRQCIICGGRLLSNCSSENQGKLDDIKQRMTMRTAMLWLQYSGYGIYTPKVHKS